MYRRLLLLASLTIFMLVIPIILLFLMGDMTISRIMVFLGGGDLFQEGSKESAYRKIGVESDIKLKPVSKDGTQIKQIYVSKLGRVDRCIMCHDAKHNSAKGKANVKNRSLNHPEVVTKYHRVEKFGCTVCHGGCGYSITADAAHGRAAPWQTPMLPRIFLQASCGRCHRGKKCPSAPLLSRGRRLFSELGCIGCHSVAGRGQKFGPDLTNIGIKDVNHDYKLNDMDWQWLFKHFKDPRAQNPNTYMPSFGLSDNDALALTLVVLSFRGAKIPDEYIVHSYSKKAVSALERGKLVFEDAGCAGCHGRNGRGGVKNPNMRGSEIPALAMLADTIVNSREEERRIIALLENGIAIEEKKDEPWLRDYFHVEERIMDGRKPEKEDPQGNDPPLLMPSWRDSVKGSDLHYLVAYIISLFPDDAWEDWDAKKMEK